MVNITEEFSIAADYIIPEWRKFIWFGLFLLSALVSIIGNLIVIWIVVVHKNMRTVTNLMILNLAVADTLIASFNIPFCSYQKIFEYWPFGSTVCKWSEFIGVTCICVTVLTLLMIAIDRYTAIVHPFKLRMGIGKAISIMILMWIVSVLVTRPNWAHITIRQISYETFFCTQIWPTNSFETTYRVIFMVGTYFLPLSCITFLYVRMASTKPSGEKSASQVEKDLAKRKVVKMMILIVVIFAICWLPIHTFFILRLIGLLKTAPIILGELEIWIFWFGMSNSMCKPLVYCWMSARFRAGFKKAFRWCSWIKYDEALEKHYFPIGNVHKPIIKQTV